MARTLPSLRFASLLAAGSIFVHELRYIAGYGGGAGEALATQGHSYLPLVEALAVVLVAVALARFTHSLVRARRGIALPRRRHHFLTTWLLAAGALAGVYTLQEGLEGAFSPGHPAGFVGVFGNGGWTALVFALAIGALIALLVGGAERILAIAVRRRPPRRRARGAAPRACRPAPALAPLDVLARNLAGRAPPLNA